MGSGGDEAGVAAGFRVPQISKTRPGALGTGQFGMMAGLRDTFRCSAYPQPDSARKFLIFNGMQQGLRSKFLILLEFFADSSWQRGYGCF